MYIFLKKKATTGNEEERTLPGLYSSGNRNIMKQIAGVAEMNDMALKEADMRTKQGKELKNATDTLC